MTDKKIKKKRKYHKKQPLVIKITMPNGKDAIFDVKDIRDGDIEVAKEFVKSCACAWSKHMRFLIENKKLEIKQKKIELKKLESYFDVR